MTPKWHVVVSIPARNEEALLPRCLRSVLIAASALPPSIVATTIVVADSCIDATQQIAEDMLRGSGHVLNTRAGTVGTGRALAGALAVRLHEGPLNRLWMANTDADCVIPPSWLVDQLRLANEGYEAVAGTVSVDSFDEHKSWVEERFRSSYFIGVDGSHPHIHGANLGIRADLYSRAGGWANLKTGEDHDLWRRLREIGARTVSTAAVQVVTSGRKVGRAPHGFAGALSMHDLLEHPSAQAAGRGNDPVQEPGSLVASGDSVVRSFLKSIGESA